MPVCSRKNLVITEFDWKFVRDATSFISRSESRRRAFISKNGIFYNPVFCRTAAHIRNYHCKVFSGHAHLLRINATSRLTV